ncbi:MAG: hypothetical protein Q9220_002355 [cf. Caloplaca sp. 1 TL-2023]
MQPLQLTWRSASVPSSSLLHSFHAFPELETNGDSHEPPKKRRKTTNCSNVVRIDPNNFHQDYLCLARIDIHLVCKVAPSPLPLLKVARPSLRMKSVKEIPGSDSGVLCHVTAEDGQTVLDQDFSGECSSSSLKALQRFIDISKTSQKKTASRVVSTIAQEPTVVGVREVGFLLCARVLFPNNREVHEAALFDRRLILDLAGVPCPAHAPRSFSPRDFYDSVFVPEKKLLASAFPRIDQLKCQLYPFQQRAIQWLIHREGGPSLYGDIGISQLAHGFVKTIDSDGRPCFISTLLGIMTDSEDIVANYTGIRGGILAEEMGLGKTVEIIGLICLHQRRKDCQAKEIDSAPRRQSHATLIITPPSILSQWKSELEALAPGLKVTTYEGLRAEDPDDGGICITKFTSHDIVLTTYSVLAREIHYAGHVPDRNFRYTKRYERRLSPLTQIEWWRVVLDEAQMVESGVSNAAKVAELIPRRNAWCVSGTPVKKNSQDLLGLLIFLRFPPYCYSAKLWARLTTERKDVFKQIFGNLALRHVKEQIKDDIQLPPQRRVIITVPFTQIEEQNYLNLYNQMCDECDLDANGAPLSENWDPDAASTIEKMRTWLLRLRQTCLHAEVGVRNRKALGKGKNPLRTVDEVLEVMTEQNSLAIRAEERALLISQARRGQMLEHAKRSKEALAIWLIALKESQIFVEEARARLRSETTPNSAKPNDRLSSHEPIDNEPGVQTGALRQRLHSALELEHMLLFFTANAYFQIKSDDSHTQPDSEDFQQLERQEEDHYEKAKLIRKEVLVEAREKVDMLMKSLHQVSSNQPFAASLQLRQLSLHGGIESRATLEKLEDVRSIIGKQATQIIAWRKKAIELLSMPLVDEENGDLQGDEYEASTQQQDTVYSYVDALRAVVSDFHDVVTGQRNMLIDHEMKVSLGQANAGLGHSPELLRELLRIRQELKPPAGVGSIRGVLTDIRELRNGLRAQLEKGNVRAGAELAVVNSSLSMAQSLSTNFSKETTTLAREVELLTDVMNARLEYYRQLQHISDTVAPYEEDLDEEAFTMAMARALGAEKSQHTRVANLKSTARYLEHLRAEALGGDVNRLCIICQQGFEIGVLTSCGHAFCVECLRLWRKHNMTCPTCKKRLHQDDLHQITYKPQEFKVQEERHASDPADATGGDPGSPRIYADINASTLDEIKNVDMNVKQSFGTKIDSIARHLIWLRENDPGSKSIVFSQFRDFLSVLATAFTSFKIGHASIDGKTGIRRFKNDPGVECLLMHAKSNSSGLTLVNATHVFLCEPLINTAIELQAVARVHRIGQHLPTTVWVYVVENTVERSIYDISVERRMAHIGRGERQRAPSSEMEADSLEGQIEAANTVEMEEAALGRLMSSGGSGGELVGKEDLWDCLFRQKPNQIRPISSAVEREVGRHLRLTAAEERRMDDEIS